MNKKGQLNLAPLLLTFVAIIVGLAIFQALPANVALVTQTINVVNQSVTAPAGGTTATILNGQAVTNVIAINASSGTVIPATNYTITNYQVVNGQLASQFTTNTGVQVGFAGKAINVSYTYEPLGYATDAGTRSIIPLILIFAALALAVVALVPTLRGGVMEMLGR